MIVSFGLAPAVIAVMKMIPDVARYMKMRAT